MIGWIQGLANQGGGPELLARKVADAYFILQDEAFIWAKPLCTTAINWCFNLWNQIACIRGGNYFGTPVLRKQYRNKDRNTSD